MRSVKCNIVEAGKNPGSSYEFRFLVSAAALDVQLPEVEIIGDIVFAGVLVYTGRAYSFNGEMKLTKRFQCDRCLHEFTKECVYPFTEEFKRRSDHAMVEENDDVNWFDGDEVELDEVFREIVILSQPLNNICSSDCRGLCLKCGADLNKGECGCDRTVLDPRLAALQKLFIQK